MHRNIFYLSIFVLIGCQAADENETIIEDSSIGNSSVLTASSQIRAGTGVCSQGGAQIDSGIDINGNGLLDSNEVQQSHIVCNGNDGYTSLIEIDIEPEGENCPSGGKVINIGMDKDRDEQLDTDEIKQVEYVCSEIISPPSEQVCSTSNDSNGNILIECLDGSTASLENEGITNSALCEGELPGLTGFNWEFLIYEINNSYIIATSSIWAMDFEVSKTELNKNLGYTIFNADILESNNYGFWEFEMNISTQDITLTYHDIDLINNEYTWIFDSSDCYQNTF